MQQHEVNAAADALVAQRLRPTVERVRLHMGRGSPNTIGPMLEAWFDTLAERLGLAASHEAAASAMPPPPIRDAMLTLWSSAVAAARAASDAALDAERQQLASDRAALMEAQDAFSRLQTAAAEREQLLREARELAQRQLQEAADQLSQLQARLREREQALVDARGGIADLVRQKDAAHREHQAQLAAHAQEHGRQLDRAAATERHLMAEVDRARQDSKVSRKAVAELELRLTRERAEHERAVQAHGQEVQALQLEQAVLRERLKASDRYGAEFQALLVGSTSRVTARRAAAPVMKPSKKPRRSSKDEQLPVAGRSRPPGGSSS